MRSEIKDHSWLRRLTNVKIVATYYLGEIMDKKKKVVRNKINIAEDILKFSDDKMVKISMKDFKSLWNVAQLDRGWTKSALEDFEERLNVSK